MAVIGRVSRSKGAQIYQWPEVQAQTLPGAPAAAGDELLELRWQLLWTARAAAKAGQNELASDLHLVYEELDRVLESVRIASKLNGGASG